jgi:hypothetical protein
MKNELNCKPEKLEEKYFLRKDRTTQIGWSIIEIVEKAHKEVFYHTSKSVIELAVQDLREGKFELNWRNNKYPPLDKDKVMIIKFNEKYGDNYFVYRSREEFYKIFLDTLVDRYDQGWYHYNVNEPKQEITMTVAEIGAIEDLKLRKFQMDRFLEQEKEMRDYKEHMQLVENTERAYKEKNPKLAYQVLSERKDGEYEGYEIIEPCN